MELKLNRIALACVTPLSLLAVVAVIPGFGCQKEEVAAPQTKMPAEPAKMPADSAKMPAESMKMPAEGASSAMMAVATIGAAGGAATQPANQHVAGTVTFSQDKEGVKAVVDLTGLSPGKHGIHIHEKTDMTAPDLTSAGGHWDPDGHKQHGGPASESAQRHAGDLGNLEADESGKAHYEVSVSGVSIGGKNDIVGHSVIVHAKEDDLKTNPAGNAGGRVAGGAIEAKPMK